MESASIVKFFKQALGDDITSIIYEFAQDTVYDEFCANLYEITRRNRRVKFQRYQKNLRYDAFFVYSYGTAVAKLDLNARTVQRLGWWSRTTSRHINYSIKFFNLFGIRETPRILS